MIRFAPPRTDEELEELDRQSKDRAAEYFRVCGRGGGGGKSGGGATSDANTMRSNARARLIEAISEGPIWGLVNGPKSMFYDQTPLQNDDGTYNFNDVIWTEHKGFADEGYFNGHSAVETPISVETQVKATTGPVQRTIVDENADAVRVIMRIPALVQQDSKGGLKKTSVTYAIDVRSNNGTWTTPVTNNIVNEKTLSPVQIAHRIDLPLGGSPWDIRVRRITADTTDDKLQNDTYWEGYVLLVEGKFTYPFTAAIAQEVNAESFGTSLPPRSYHVRGLLLKVPSNYDPETRSYFGIWDGTFKIAWTNNPAWVFYDLLINDRYGLGEFVTPEIVDKWSLYAIARYCDELVPSGYKNGDTGEDILEPRFTYNGVINSKDEAFSVLQSITTAWRGMAYWALGQVFATADMPRDPDHLVVPANVINAEFEYAGTAIKARHSVILVKWNDPDDFYRQSTEVVIDTDLLHKYGWREKTVQLRGCTSRGLAHRYGKWIIDTEQHETDTLTYSASWDHAQVRPGEIIAVSDPRKAQIRAGGRIVRHHGLEITLDAPFERTEDATYSLMLTMPTGLIEKRAILAFLDDQTVRIASAFSAEALPDAVWSITGTDVVPRTYRVLTIDENEPNIFKITALTHDPLKYARVERGLVFEKLPYERAPKVAKSPSNLVVRESAYVSGNQTRSRLTISWSPPPNVLTRGFVVSVNTPNDGFLTLGTTEATFFEMEDAETGDYTFYVQSINYVGAVSQAAEIDHTAVGVDGIPVPRVVNLVLIDNPLSSNFDGPDLKIHWANEFSSSLEGGASTDPSPMYSYNTVRLYDVDSGLLLRETRVTDTSFTYSLFSNKTDHEVLGLEGPSRDVRIVVTVSDTLGRTSVVTTRTFWNSSPAVITATLQASGQMITMAVSEPLDGDYAGWLCAMTTTPGVNPATATIIHDGKANPMIYNGQAGVTYYFRVAAYDQFGKMELNWSPEMSIKV